MLKRKVFRFALLSLTLTFVFNFALSTVSFAHGKGYRGRQGDKKAEKFVNGHDARDGRLDGRGPRFRARERWRRNEWRENRFRSSWRENNFRDARWRHRRLQRRRHF